MRAGLVSERESGRAGERERGRGGEGAKKSAGIPEAHSRGAVAEIIVFFPSSCLPCACPAKPRGSHVSGQATCGGRTVLGSHSGREAREAGVEGGGEEGWRNRDRGVEL